MKPTRRYLIHNVALSLAKDAAGTHQAAAETHDLLIVDGRVERIEASNALPDEDERTIHIEGDGLVVLPGFTDLYTRLREPGAAGRGNLASESRAALAAGFTQVLCSPDTDPVIDDTATLQLIRQRASEAPGARVLPVAALTRGLDGRELSPLATLQGLGCPAAGQADRPILDTNVLLSAMQYASTFDLPLIMTARDAQLGVGGCAHEGAIAARLGLPGIPVTAETVALARLLELVRESGCRVHIARVSSARAVELIGEAKAAGLPVTADVGIHHLLFSEAELDGFDARYHSAVPFRSAQDRTALRAGIRDGVLDAICSDHAPHDSDAWLAPFPSCAPGLSAYDHFLPALLALPSLLELPFSRVLECVTRGATSAIGLASATGDGIIEGMAADLILVDPTWSPDVQTGATGAISAGLNTPLADVDNLARLTGENAPLHGRVQLALVDGDIRLDRLHE